MTFIIGTPHTKGAGYYNNNDTPSGGKLTEADVRTCLHCQAIILLQKWKEDGGWCGRCNAPICGPCADRMEFFGCEPFIAQIEKEFNTSEKLFAFRKLAGLDPPAPTQDLILPDRR